MPVTLYQSDGVLVPPVADARLYEMLSGGAVGIVQGCEITSLGGNQLQITSGWGVCKGRAFYIEQETINATTSPGGEVSGRLILNIDVSNSGIPAAFVTQAQSPLPELVQEDINLDGNIYQMPLSIYNIGELSISDLRTVYPKANVSGIGLYIHSKSGTVHEFTGQGANGRALMTADVSSGDTITVNGEPVTAYMGTDNATESMAGSPYTGKWVTFVVEDGVLNFKGGGGKVTVEGLSAETLLAGTTVTVKQGTKVVERMEGVFSVDSALRRTDVSSKSETGARDHNIPIVSPSDKPNIVSYYLDVFIYHWGAKANSNGTCTIQVNDSTVESKGFSRPALGSTHVYFSKVTLPSDGKTKINIIITSDDGQYVTVSGYLLTH